MDTDPAGSHSGLPAVLEHDRSGRSLALVIGAGLVIAICSATQDITIDALRIEQIDKDDARGMAAGAAVAVVGWWSGYKLGGMAALFRPTIWKRLVSRITGR